MVVNENYVKLEIGKPVRLHFIDHGIMDKIVTDPVLKWKKTVKSLVFKVDRMDGDQADTVFSTLSEKLWAEFEPYLDGQKYLNYEFVIVKDIAGFMPPRIVEIRPYTR